MTVYAITDTKKGEQGLRLLIFKLPKLSLKIKVSGRHYSWGKLRAPGQWSHPRAGTVLVLTLTELEIQTRNGVKSSDPTYRSMS